MSWITRRQHIIKEIRKMLILDKNKGSDKILIFRICYEFGCAERTAKEYLKTARSRK